ncbi:MAG: hypothetical protein PHE25_01890 [Candidatus Gracilibacteria bacterium]|nr:hypothetical protein [Candidatus Gracilibacteria bacterium]
MKLFILSSIGENIFINKSEIEELLNNFSLNLDFVNIGCICGYFGEIENDNFSLILPVLNGFTGKYFFYNSLKISILPKYILGKNILDFEYDEKKIIINSKQIENIKIELDSNKLITNSKKQEFLEIILLGVYNIGGFLIKTYFLMDEMISNKNDLQNIINNPNGFIEYKSQAILLDKIAFDKLDLIKVRFDLINLQLANFSQILYKYFNNYIK